MPQTPESDYLSVKEVAAQLGLSAATTYRLIEWGDLPAYRFGGRYKVRSDDLTEYIERSKFQPENGGGQ